MIERGRKREEPYIFKLWHVGRHQEVLSRILRAKYRLR